MTNNQKIDHVKRLFKDYKFQKLVVTKIDFKILELSTIIENYKTSPVIIPTGTVTHDPHKFSKEEDEREKLIRKRKAYQSEVDNIDSFLKSICDEHERILRLKFFINETLTYRNIENLIPEARSGIHRIVNKLCLEYWDTYHNI